MAIVYSSTGDSFQPAVRMTVGDSLSSRNNVFDLLGGGVAVTFGSIPLRSGSFQFAFLSEADAYWAYTVLRDGHVFLINDADAVTTNFSFVVSGEIVREWDSSTTSIWTLSVDFQEVQS